MFAVPASQRVIRTFGVAAIVAASAALASGVAAQDRVADTSRIIGSPACQGFTPDQAEAMVRCEMKELDKRIEAAKQGAAKAREESATARTERLEAELVKECGDYLKTNRGTSFSHQRMMELAGGKITGENVCSVAKALGFVGRKASLTSPDVR